MITKRYLNNNDYYYFIDFFTREREKNRAVSVFSEHQRTKLYG